MPKLNKIDDILKNAKVVKEDGTPYIPTRLEKLDDWCFDHIFGYAFVWRLWHNHLSPSCLYHKLKRLCQRIVWGFDDSETWALDWSFYKWIYPRLKRFEKITQAYPINTTFKDWKKELQKRVKQLDAILNIDEFDFNDWSYIPKKEFSKLKEKVKEDHSWKMTVNATAYEYCQKDFNKWFCDNLKDLGW